MHYTIYDVGGQRNERRKWIHCFADVTAIIFVAAISEYDQTLYEENTANRLVEAIELFGKVCGSRHFEETPIILFLNKRDIFESACGQDASQYLLTTACIRAIFARCRALVLSAPALSLHGLPEPRITHNARYCSPCCLPCSQDQDA